MPNLSIRARLIFLSVLLLAILVLSSALLIRELARDSRSLTEEATFVSVVKNANSVSKHFGDLKYWVIDAAVTQLARSEQAAEAAKAGLDSDLKAISAVDPAFVAAIEREVDAMTSLARQAGVAYSSDDSAAGNALLEQAKSHVPDIDSEIDKIVDRVERQAVARRDASTRQAELAVKLAIVGGIGALVLALGFTALTVRSITVPLKALERSIASITQGELEVAMPPTGVPEIGAMTRTLGMLRDSLIERTQLERKRQQAEAEMRVARDAAEAALHDLKAAQANLIQAEKMASLGQLTAGIAHEIKNPLNFVNNFAGLSVELLDELKAAAAPAVGRSTRASAAEVDEVVEMLTGNLEKIVEHGKRADGIVKSMLAHSRGGSGDRQSVDLNALVEEALNLAYHGARAQDQDFNITLEREYGDGIAPVELVPQDMTRVFLNLFGNGFYAANKRRRDGGQRDFRPVLAVTTRDLGERRRGAGARQWHRHSRRHQGQAVPAVLHHQADRRRHRARPVDQLRDRHAAAWRHDRGRQRVGEFTEFIVRLPRASAPERSAIQRQRAEVMTVSILIVDDEPDVADLFRQQFRREARQGTYVLHFALSAAGGARHGSPATSSRS